MCPVEGGHWKIQGFSYIMTYVAYLYAAVSASNATTASFCIVTTYSYTLISWLLYQEGKNDVARCCDESKL
ncbi:hypothetical protein F4823DRAFT_585892, partial [Ustulina deusta]